MKGGREREREGREGDRAWFIPMMTLRGVRISCDIVARNCDLASLAACACCACAKEGKVGESCVTESRERGRSESHVLGQSVAVARALNRESRVADITQTGTHWPG